MTSSKRPLTVLAGSAPRPIANALITGAARPSERLEVTLVLQPSDPTALADHADKVRQGLAQPLTRAAYMAQHASSDADVQKVRTFAAAHNMSVVEVDTAAHRIVLSTTVQDASAAFSVNLHMFAHPDGGMYRTLTDEIHLPQELDDVVIAVLGLDNHPIAKPYVRATAATYNGHLPNEIAGFYNFPPGDGHGQCIALIELGGGYRMEDLTTYFTQQVGLQTVPTVTSVSVGYATNTPVGNPGSADGEVVLDIEVAAAIAPAARISVYFAPNTEAGFLNAITTATHDMINRPTVMSISWGASENRWSLQAMRAIDAAFYQAAVLGINVFVASGDAGSSDSIADGANHVDFPASSPHAIACGGTNIQVSNGAITSETVWNQASQTAATGGGFSNIFRSFAWQKAVAPYMRGVPDVAGNADPTTGYLVLVDGQHWIMGGTSAVAPLWAALVARIQANLGHRIGYVHERLYANPSALRDITVGNNGSFTAKVGWDACTGLGSPNGTAVQAIF